MAGRGASFQQAISNGKFHGTIRATGPTGSRSTRSSPASCTGTTEPRCWRRHRRSTRRSPPPLHLPPGVADRVAGARASVVANRSSRSRARPILEHPAAVGAGAGPHAPAVGEGGGGGGEGGVHVGRTGLGHLGQRRAGGRLDHRERGAVGRVPTCPAMINCSAKTSSGWRRAIPVQVAGGPGRNASYGRPRGGLIGPHPLMRSTWAAWTARSR